ncbi:hypothetical protein GCM10007973_26110 [Polymorphobacter multimanifer]|uniref:hypothetical protein n=1 Tax=Polymorphobacter multimanifer TaxID=1070431 RepID=UPI001664F3E2|nr:hypothetical protein [Polymorphobacter multimanifer]GGI88536.1 hypothetical protein GCM10007973_26110 [Polymorphobacter multimanifer]
MNNDPLDPTRSTPVTSEKPQSGTILSGAENRIYDFAEDAKVEIAKSMNGLVVSAHNWAANLDSMAGAPVGDLARQAADLLGSIQRGLEEKPVSELVADGEALIRRQPGIALGVAVAGGFLLARMVRSGKE